MTRPRPCYLIVHPKHKDCAVTFERDRAERALRAGSEVFVVPAVRIESDQDFPSDARGLDNYEPSERRRDDSDRTATTPPK